LPQFGLPKKAKFVDGALGMGSVPKGRMADQIPAPVFLRLAAGAGERDANRSTIARTVIGRVSLALFLNAGISWV
jgi:hypothetical protein